MVKNKDLEKMIYDFYDTEVPEPNQQILDDLKTKMHQRTISSTKKPRNKFRLALVSCIAIILLIPAVTLPFVWNNLFPSDSNTPPEEEIYYSDSDLTMVDLTPEELNSILIGGFSKYVTLLEDYTTKTERGYYSEDNTLVYVNLEITKNSIPFSDIKLNIVFVENYEHEYSKFFKNINEFTQYENCKLYETIFQTGYKNDYYKLVEFEDYKVYLQQDKQDSSIINSIVQS